MDNPEKLAQDKENKTKTQHYMQINTNNVNKTWALPQRTGGKDEPNIVFMRKSQRTYAKMRLS